MRIPGCCHIPTSGGLPVQVRGAVGPHSLDIRPRTLAQTGNVREKGTWTRANEHRETLRRAQPQHIRIVAHAWLTCRIPAQRLPSGVARANSSSGNRKGLSTSPLQHWRRGLAEFLVSSRTAGRSPREPTLASWVMPGTKFRRADADRPHERWLVHHHES